MAEQVFRRQILYELYWQKLRLSCLGGWGHAKGIASNLDVLSEYVTIAVEQKGDPNKIAMRIYRVRNLLNAVLLGQPGDRVMVTKARNSYDELQLKYPLQDELWDWSIVARQLQGEHRKTLVMMRQNLIKRRRVASKRGLDPKESRPELETFLGLIDGELARRQSKEIET